MTHLAQGYATKNAFECYIKYSALKQHFTSKKYDYFKYNGKVRTSYDSFCKRNDIYYFSKLAKEKDHTNMILSNVLINPSIWIKDIVDNNEIYLHWKKRNDALTYTFSSDLNKLKESYKDNFIVQGKNSYPYLIELFNQKQISPETATILVHLSNTMGYWKNNVADTIIFPDILFKLERYHGFLQYDEKKFSGMIKNRFF